MQQYQIKITELAEKDLENIGDYIAEQLLNPEAATYMVQGIQRQIHKLHYFPERNELDNDLLLKKLEIRKTYYKKYKIYYVVDNKTMTVYIVRILHMLEDSKAQLYKIFE